MAEKFQKFSTQFMSKGLNLNRPVDLLVSGQNEYWYPILKNVREYLDGRLEQRYGLTVINASALGNTNIHTLKRLNDPVPSAVQDWTRLVGADTVLYSGKTSFTSRKTGFSGKPLTMCAARPTQSPDPWMYVGDTNQMWKIRTDGTNYQMGIAPPLLAPTVSIGALAYKSIADFETKTGWTPDGTFITAGNTKDVPTDGITPRINTTIAAILYDAGTTGFANIVPTAMSDNIQPGVVLILGTNTESVIVEDTFVPIASTTIAKIIYDSGTSGLCTIQLTTPTTGLELNTIVRIATAEYVLVQSVTTGPDGIPSFRCSTTGTRSAGDAVDGARSFRASLANAHVVTDTIVDNQLQVTITAGTGYITSTPANTNLALLSNNRPIQNDDEIHISLKIDNLANLTEIQIMADCDASTNDFAHNYFTRSILPPAIVPALQFNTTALIARQQAFKAGQIQDLTVNNSDVALGQSVVKSSRFLTEDGGSLDSPPLDFSGFTIDGSSLNASQTGVGNNQWQEVICKISDFTRVGNDTSRSWANIAKIRITFVVTSSVVAEMDSWWVGGSFGPSVGDQDVGYSYIYRGRSTTTGAVSNPSPPQRSPIRPQRQQDNVACPQLADTQVDKLDVFRFGGTLTQWNYVGSATNTPASAPATVTFADVYPDDSISSNIIAEFDDFQPFPSVDAPRSGVVNVAGTKVSRVSGDNFNTSWARGSQLRINGVPTRLYTSPTSTSAMEIEDAIGSLTSVTWEMPEATLLGQPLPALWGPYGLGETGLYLFACGDTRQPGTLFWTKTDNPDSAPDVNTLEVCSGSEILMNGGMYDGRAFVMSSERMWFIDLTYGFGVSGSTSIFRTQEVANSKGLFCRYGICVGPKIWFIGRDGVYECEGGEPRSITDAALFPWLPNEGNAGVAINGIAPPDFTQVDNLRLSYYDGYLYFDFKDTSSNLRTAVYDTGNKAWYYDVYTPGIVTHYGEEGASIHSILCGGSNGKVYQLAGVTGDDTVAVSYQVRTPSVNLNDLRSVKQWAELLIDIDTASNDVSVVAGFNRFDDVSATFTLNNAARWREVINLLGGAGQFSQDCGIDISWSTALGDVTIYNWELWYLPKEELAQLRVTDWDEASTPGAKFVQGCRIKCNTFAADMLVQIQYEGSAANVGADFLTVNSGPGESIVALSWTPFIAHNMRIVPLTPAGGSDPNFWIFYGVEWVYEPCPELTDHWIAPVTTFGLSGYTHARDGYVTHRSTVDFIFRLAVDGINHDVTIPNGGGVQTKTYVIFPSVKGKQYQPEAIVATPGDPGFRIYQQDLEIRVKSWGQNQPYQTVKPLGDENFRQGAAI